MTGIKASDLTPEQKLEGYRQILDELITEKLVNKAAAGITVPQADVDTEIHGGPSFGSATGDRSEGLSHSHLGGRTVRRAATEDGP